MVACALARKKAITDARDNEIAARLGERLGGHADEGNMEEGEEVNLGAVMRGMADEANTLRTAFPGLAWELGMRAIQLSG